MGVAKSIHWLVIGDTLLVRALVLNQNSVYVISIRRRAVLGPIDNPVDLEKALKDQPDKKLMDELKKKTGLKDHELIDWIKKNISKE